MFVCVGVEVLEMLRVTSSSTVQVPGINMCCQAWWPKCPPVSHVPPPPGRWRKGTHAFAVAVEESKQVELWSCVIVVREGQSLQKRMDEQGKGSYIF